MKTPLLGYTEESNTGSVTYHQLYASRDSWLTTAPTPGYLAPIAGSISNFNIKIDVAPGAGKSYTFVLMVNDLPTSLSVTISGSNTEGSDNANSISISAGDNLYLRCTPSGTPDKFNHSSYYLIWNGDVEESVLMGSGNWSFGNEFFGVQGSGSTLIASNSLSHIAPCAGTLSDLYFEINTAIGANLTVRFLVNGVPTSLQVVLANGNTSVNNTVHSVSFSAGDILSFNLTGASTTAGFFGWGVRFTPDVDGDCPIMFAHKGTDIANLNVTIVCGQLGASNDWISDSASIRKMMSPGMSVDRFYMQLATAPGVGNSIKFTLRQNQTDSVLTATISGASTTANNLSDTVSIVDKELLDVQAVLTGTPASPMHPDKFSFVANIPSVLRPMIFHTRSNAEPFIFYDVSDNQAMIFSSRN